jgi:hypothetical protein
MAERGGGAGLAEQALARAGGVRELDGDPAAQQGVFAQVHNSHAALAKRLQHTVMGERLSQQFPSGSSPALYLS